MKKRKNEQIGILLLILQIGIIMITAVAVGHLIAEKPVAPDMAEAAQLLHGGKLLLVFLMERQVQPAGADAVTGRGCEGCRITGMDHDVVTRICFRLSGVLQYTGKKRFFQDLYGQIYKF